MEGPADKRLLKASANIGDILIIGEHLRVQMHTAKPHLIKDRKHHFKTHTCCFVGSDVIDWLLSTDQAPDRQIAIQLISILLDNQVIHHVSDFSPFKDENQLYRFRKDDGTFPFCEDTAVFLRGQKLSQKLFSRFPASLVRPQEEDGVLYENTFQGHDLVEWLVTRKEAVSRDSAVAELRRLLENDVLRHVTNTHHFKDTGLLYQFRSDFGRKRILLDLVLPSPVPEYGGLSEEYIHQMAAHSPQSEALHIPVLDRELAGEPDPVGKQVHIVESGYDSDHADGGSPCSASSQEDKWQEAGQFLLNTGVIIRKASMEELDALDSPYAKKYIRVSSDPVGYGFVIRGEGPVFVKIVDPTGPAAAAGLKVGHYIFSVNDQKVLHMNHRDLATVILGSNGYINLIVMQHSRDVT